jgi:hypothetical protein
MHSMGRARNPDNPRSVAAQNEQSTLRFVPFASGANLVPELKEANEKRGQTARNLFSSGSARKGAGRRYGPSGSTMRPLRSSANFDVFNDRRLPCHLFLRSFRMQLGSGQWAAVRETICMERR